MEEGFVGRDEIPTMKTCPPKTTKIITNGGDEQCCEGTTDGKKCNGNIACSLTEPRPGGPKGCGEYIKQKFNKNAGKFCPRAMNRYFDNSINFKGCTSGARKPDWSAPVNMNDRHCIIYNTEKDDLKNQNSCYIQKKLENIKCPTSKSKKQYVGGLPGCAFEDTNNIPRFCVDKDSWLKQQRQLRPQLRPQARPQARPQPKRQLKWFEILNKLRGNTLQCFTGNKLNENCKDYLQYLKDKPNSAEKASHTKALKNTVDYCKLSKNKTIICNTVLQRKIENFYDQKAVQEYISKGGRDFQTIMKLQMAPPARAPAAPAGPKKMTWAQITQEFPGSTSLPCYASDCIPGNCSHILQYVKEAPDPGEKATHTGIINYLKNFCKSSNNNNIICREVLRPSPAPARAPVPPPKPKVYTIEEEAERGVWICDVAKKYYIDRSIPQQCSNSITNNCVLFEPTRSK